MSFASLLDSKCTILRQSYTSDGQGGYTSSDVILHRRVPCRFEDLPKKLEIVAYDQKAVFPDYVIYLEWRANIKEGYIVKLDSREFEIKLVNNWSEAGKKMELFVSELQRGE